MKCDVYYIYICVCVCVCVCVSMYRVFELIMHLVNISARDCLVFLFVRCFYMYCTETKEMIGSYGVYCRRAGSGGGLPSMGNCEDDGGFSQDDNKQNSGYYSERMVVVNSARNGTTTNTIVEPDATGKADDKFQWCCFNDTTGTEKIPSERNSHWYKSSVLLLLLAVVLAVVVLVSGLLLYFKYTNCKYYFGKLYVDYNNF